MTTGGIPEPTNEQLWAQPPAAPYAVQPTPAPLPVPMPPTQPAPLPMPLAQPARQGNGVLALAITSLGVGIPLTAIAVSAAGIPGLIIAWLGIVGVNAVFAFGQRR